ncbi:MAG: hypothetical protein NZ480_01500, partial [Bdellovibrionaceae bacterium]|nr:hypothetical protein [Pseudobdellovibrionaceae bacterium]
SESVSTKNVKDSTSTAETSSHEVGNNRIGIMGGVFQNNMKIEVSGTTFNYSDMSMALGGFVDIPFADNIDLRGKAGYLQYSVAKDGVSASLGYLSLEGTLQLKIVGGLWIGGGGAFLLTVSRNNNIPGLDASSATNSFFLLGLGYDIRLGKGAILPLCVDYILFPGGSGISANSLAIRAGYGWAF